MFVLSKSGRKQRIICNEGSLSNFANEKNLEEKWNITINNFFFELINKAESLLKESNFKDVPSNIKEKLKRNDNTQFYNVIISNFKANSSQTTNSERKFFCDVQLHDSVLNKFAELFGKEYLNQNIGVNKKRIKFAVEMNYYLTNKRNNAKKYLKNGHNLKEFLSYFEALNDTFLNVINIKNSEENSVINHVKDTRNNNNITISNVNVNSNNFNNVKFALIPENTAIKTPYFIVLENQKIGLLKSNDNVYYNFTNYFKQKQHLLKYFQREEGEEGDITYNLLEKFVHQVVENNSLI